VSWAPIDDLVAGIMAGRLHNPVMIMGVLAAAASRRNGWADLRPSDDPWTFRAKLLAAGRRR